MSSDTEDAMPEAMPGAAPEALPDAVPDAVPRRRPLRRFGLVVLLSFAIGTGALALLGFALRGTPIAAPQWVQERVAERAAAALPGATVRFDRMELLVEDLWRPRLHLTGVELRGAQGATLARIEDIRSGFALEPLLRGEIAPSRISVTGAVLTLRRLRDGRFNLALGAGAEPFGQAPDFVSLIEGLDRVFADPRLAELDAITANGLTIRYEDFRAGRAWTVDGGRARLVQRAGALELSGDVVLLSGGSEAATLEASYFSPRGSAEARISLSVDGMPAADLATQSPALAWLGALRAPISGAVRAGVDAGGALLPLSATLQIGQGALKPNDETRPVPFRSARTYFTYDPATELLVFDELSVDSDWITGRAEGSAELRGLQTGWPEALIGQFTFNGLSANPDGLYDAPVRFDSAAADLRLVLDPFRFDLGQAVLRAGDDTLVMSGHVAAEPEGWSVAMDGRMEQLSRDRLLELWPVEEKPRTRRWIDTNIASALFTNVTATLRGEPDARPEFYLGLGYRDAEVRFMKTLPPIVEGHGRLELFRNALTVIAEAGQVTAPQGGRVDIAGSVFHIPDVRVKQAPAKLRLTTQSTITAALSLLDAPPFEFLTKAAQPVTLADGRAALNGLIGFRLKPKQEAGEVRYDIDGTLRAVRSSTLVPGRLLAASVLTVAADNDGVRIGGEGRLGQVPFKGSWTQPLGRGAPVPGRVEAEVELSERFLDEFRITLPPGSVGGAGRAQVTLDLAKGAPPAFALRSDLAGLRMAVAPLDWTKPPRARGALEVTGALATPPQIDVLRLDAPGLAAEGRVLLTAVGGLDRVVLDRVRTGEWLDVSAVLVGQGKNAPPSVEVSGGTIDIRRTSAGTTGAATTDGAAPRRAGGPIKLALDRLQISEGIALTDFRGDFVTAGGFEGTFTGRVNGQVPVTGRVLPDQAGRSAFRILSKDAGGALRAAGLLKQGKGGDLALTLLPRGGEGSYDGTLRIEDVRMQDAPAMAQLLDAISVVGILDQLNGPGILFTDVDGTFRLTPKRVIVTQSSAIGPSLGVSMDGIYQLDSGKMDMQGVISPIYLLNGIGSIFTRKGEGLIGFNFNLRGTAESPRVAVNPLSALTPGLFREIFRRPAPQVGN